MKRARRKRPNGEGSIYYSEARARKGHAPWVAVAPRQAFYRYGWSQGEALRKRDEEMAVRRRTYGVSGQMAKQPVADFMEGWLHTMSNSLRPRTHDGYSIRVRLHIIPIIGDIPLWKVGPADIQRVIDTVAKRGTITTAREVRRVMYQAMNYAVQWRLIPFNPVLATWPPKKPDPKGAPYSPAEFAQWLDYLVGHRLEAVALLLTLVGLRRGEALALKWSDVDLDGATAKIGATLQRYRGRLHFDPCKTPKSNRTVALPQRVVLALREHRERQKIRIAEAAEQWQEHDLVFPTIYGTPQDPNNCYRRLRVVMKEAGIPVRRVHDLRHTAATLMLREGVQLKIVQAQLGHSSAHVTLDTYGHVYPEMQEQAASAMDRVAERETRLRREREEANKPN